MAEDRGRKADDGKQMTEIKGQKIEDRMWKWEGGIRNVD